MNREIKERLKSVVIIVLILAGIFQVGILWSYQNEGTPPGFLSALFRRAPKISDEDIRQALFRPSRIVLSGGDMSHWIVRDGSTGHDILWNEAINGLVRIATGREQLDEAGEEWGDIVEKKGFIIDFGYDIEPALLSWFLGVGKSPQNMPSIRKIMVKRDIIDKNLGTFYIRSGDGAVYVSGPIRYNDALDVDRIVETLSSDENQMYRNYYTLGGSNIAESMGAEPDVLYVSGAPKYWTYRKFTASPPERANSGDDLAEVLLGAEKDLYFKSVGGDTVQFSFVNSFYEYHEDGYISYNYLGSAGSSGEDGISGVLANAYRFAAVLKRLLAPNVGIMLSSVDDIGNGTYEIGFDYKIDDMPVKVDVEMRDGSGKKLAHAICVQANGHRVIKCDALLKDFSVSGEGRFNDRLIDLLGQSGIAYREMNIKDMQPGYYIGPGTSDVLVPALLIKLKDGRSIHIEMTPEKGD